MPPSIHRKLKPLESLGCIDIYIKARCLTAEDLASSPAAILSQTGFLAGSVVSGVRNTEKYSYLVEILTDLQTVWFLTNVINVAIILDDYL